MSPYHNWDVNCIHSLKGKKLAVVGVQFSQWMQHKLLRKTLGGVKLMGLMSWV
jgi:hypothetical protein